MHTDIGWYDTLADLSVLAVVEKQMRFLCKVLLNCKSKNNVKNE